MGGVEEEEEDGWGSRGRGGWVGSRGRGGWVGSRGRGGWVG